MMRLILLGFIFFNNLSFSQIKDSIREKEIVGVNFIQKKKIYGNNLEKNLNKIMVEEYTQNFSAITKMEVKNKIKLLNYNFYITSKKELNKFPLSFVILDENLRILYKKPLVYRKGYNTVGLNFDKVWLNSGIYYFGINFELEDTLVVDKFTYGFKYYDKQGNYKTKNFIGSHVGFFKSKGNSENFFFENNVLLHRPDIEICHNLEMQITEYE